MTNPITRRRRIAWGLCAALALLAWVRPAAAADVTSPDADELLSAAVDRLLTILEPEEGQPARTLVARGRVVKATGLPRQAEGATAELAFQAPDRLRVSAVVEGQAYAAGRDGQSVWVHEPGKRFALLAHSGVPRFKADPASVDDTVLPPFALPVSRLKLRLGLMMLSPSRAPDERIGGADCYALRVTLRPKAQELLGVEAGTATVWLRKSDVLPVRVAYADPARGADVQVDLNDVGLVAPLAPERWRLAPGAGDKVETVALSHLVKFAHAAPKLLRQDAPPPAPATGVREVVDTSGKGRLERIDGNRVLFLRGTPEEMGRQHGTLLRAEIHDVAERILYGVGVGSSFVKGNWFFGEIEGATARLLPHMDERYPREIDAIAAAAGMHPQEARLANFFPELFHCSGFALVGKASGDGHVYHGRVLDYMKGVGLEQNAVVIVHQPDGGRHAWVNVSYAGFVGSVTAMNEKGIAIGEMGGRGYGAWDGKPMAQLVRDVMERAATLDEAVAIMRAGPRTCEYYYVISDGNAKTAVGIAATPDKFETVKPGEAHPLLPRAVEDAVVLSAGDRYQALVDRVQGNHGRFDPASARALMTRPVCMNSNIQSVLFRPDTLDLWVANADGRDVASHSRYARYNLRDLLAPKGAPKAGKAAKPAVGF